MWPKHETQGKSGRKQRGQQGQSHTGPLKPQEGVWVSVRFRDKRILCVWGAGGGELMYGLEVHSDRMENRAGRKAGVYLQSPACK